MNASSTLLALVLAATGIVAAQTKTQGGVTMKITSTAFAEGGMIPKKYTCDGANVNPSLRIAGAPASARSLVLIVDDPDAPGGTWNHWLVWNLDPAAAEVKENSVPERAVQGRSDFGTARYGGPCPPSGVHRYYFKIYALDTVLDLAAGSQRAALDKAMGSHVVARGELMGRYSRQR